MLPSNFVLSMWVSSALLCSSSLATGATLQYNRLIMINFKLMRVLCSAQGGQKR